MKQYSFLILMIIQLIWLWFCYSDSYYDHLNQIHISHILILILWFWILYIGSTVLSVLQRQKSVFQYFYWIFVDALQLSSYQYFSTLFRNLVFLFLELWISYQYICTTICSGILYPIILLISNSEPFHMYLIGASIIIT